MHWTVVARVALICSALCSGSEIAYVTSERVRAELDAKRGGPLSHILNLFYSHSSFFITTILVGNNIMLVIYGMGASALLDPWLRQWVSGEAVLLLCSTLISTGVILLAGEFFPKIIFRINPNSSLKVLAIPLYLFYIVLFPVSMLTTCISRGLMALAGIKGERSRAGLLSVGDLNQYLERTIEDQHAEEVENEVKIFHNALDFSTNHLRDCMIPRNEIKGVDIETADVVELEELFTSTGRSKAIIYRGDIDNVVGYIHVSELFTATDSDWKERVKPVLFAPETLLSNKMMRRLLAEKRSVAIVVDEFGGTAGMVTLEDLVEEIFGDIQDEHDTPDLISRCIDDHTWEFSGRVEIESINETFHLGLAESDEYQTIAGYVLYLTGSIPEVGTCIDIPDRYTVEVMEKTASRLELIRIIKNNEP
ncbi:MAG: hemolysin family protein [Muribaculaceae bacterium]|nr:hemolysin family protein [Muribaculaceae bacterium]